jgi:ribosomal protein S18 acetylase RimI-like enzyme
LLPQVQGKGWGRKMMAQMENQLKNLGSAGFHLRVSAHNERGLNFYAALGYTELLKRGDEVVVGKRFSI